MTKKEDTVNQGSISLEVAEEQFDNFCEMMDIDDDLSAMNDEEQVSFEKHKRTLIRRMVDGSMVVNADGEAEYCPKRIDIEKDPLKRLVFHERTGAHMLSMDKQKKNHDMAKMYGVLAGMCHVSPQIFAKMQGPDLKTCEALFVLLMV